MKYVSCAEMAQALGTTIRRVQQMCKNDEIAGAIKKGRVWMIPEDMLIPKEEKRRPLPVGVSDFKEAVSKYYYVDKTLMIRDFIDSQPKVSLFTRPRRFGKTLNMDMFRVFFELSKDDTSIYFHDKLIWECGETYRQYQGKYPVIFLTFKDVKCSTWEETKDQICKLITLECRRHAELEVSSELNKYEKEQFKILAKGIASAVDYQMSLQILSILLHKHYKSQTIIIIDEYDTPIQQGYICGFYDEVVNFMRNFFSGGLKDNPHLAYGFMTGILRVAKESIFSGLNNLKINSILDVAYSQYFGFTKAEVQTILNYYGVGEKIKEVCSWYDGYQFGKTEIFNPWSVINYIDEKCMPKAFWQSTGSNDIIGEIIRTATPEVKENLRKLLCGESIVTYIDTNVIYPEVQKNPYSIYSFLLMAGYLRVAETFPQFDGNYMCEISIPNKEIAYVYEKEILNRTEQSGISISIRQAIFLGEVQKLQNLLSEFMVNSVSSLDGGNEGFYHGMMLGLCAVLNNQYQIKSNRESGLGRFDIMLIPRERALPGFIFEFKYTRDTTTDLEELASEALKQIDSRKYETELLDLKIHQIIKIGIAFRGKSAIVKM